MRIGEESAKTNVVDRLLIPRVNPQVIEAINMSSMPSSLKALGILEFFSVTGAIIAADAAAKAANVSLIEIRLGTGIGGKSFVTFTGDVGAVEESVEAGAKTAENSGALLEKVVIAHPADGDLAVAAYFTVHKSLLGHGHFTGSAGAAAVFLDGVRGAIMIHMFSAPSIRY